MEGITLFIRKEDNFRQKESNQLDRINYWILHVRTELNTLLFLALILVSLIIQWALKLPPVSQRVEIRRRRKTHNLPRTNIARLNSFLCYCLIKLSFRTFGTKIQQIVVFHCRTKFSLIHRGNVHGPNEIRKGASKVFLRSDNVIKGKYTTCSCRVLFSFRCCICLKREEDYVSITFINRDIILISKLL